MNIQVRDSKSIESAMEVLRSVEEEYGVELRSDFSNDRETRFGCYAFCSGDPEITMGTSDYAEFVEDGIKLAVVAISRCINVVYRAWDGDNCLYFIGDENKITFSILEAAATLNRMFLDD